MKKAFLNFFFRSHIEVTFREPMTVEELYSNETTYDVITRIEVDVVKAKIFRAFLLLIILVATLLISAP